MEIKTKYNINDEVYFIQGYKIFKRKISDINIYIKKDIDKKVISLIEYTIDLELSTGRLGDNYITRLESAIFSTKEELIKSIE